MVKLFSIDLAVSNTKLISTFWSAIYRGIYLDDHIILSCQPRGFAARLLMLHYNVVDRKLIVRYVWIKGLHRFRDQKFGIDIYRTSEREIQRCTMCPNC